MKICKTVKLIRYHSVAEQAHGKCAVDYTVETAAADSCCTVDSWLTAFHWELAEMTAKPTQLTLVVY